MSGGHPAGSTALSLDRCHIHQKPAGRTDCLDRCDSGCRSQCRRQARSPRPCHRRIRSVRREIGAPSPISFSASPFWKDFLRSLTARGLRGVKLVIADDHKGLRAAATKVLNTSQQRCRVHWMRNLLGRVGKTHRPAVTALVKTVFVQETQDAAREQWRTVSDSLRDRFPAVADLMDTSEEDVLAYMAFPKEHWTRDPLDQPARTAQQGDQAAYQCRRRSGIPSDRWQSCLHSQMMPPSFALSAHCCWSKMTSGPSPGDTCHWKVSTE